MYRMPEKQIKMKWNAFELRSKRFSSVCKLPIVHQTEISWLFCDFSNCFVSFYSQKRI